MTILASVVGRTHAWTLPARHLAELRAQWPHHRIITAADDDEVRRLLPEADVAFTGLVDHDMLRRAPRLRWLQLPTAAVGPVFGPERIARDLIVTNARGLRAQAIAEHVLGVMLALARHLPLAMRAQSAREWAQEAIESAAPRTLRGRQLGLIGLGAIGRDVARLAAAVGLRVAAVRRRLDQPRPPGVDEVLPPEAIDALLRRSEIVVLCAALTPATRHVLDTRRIAALPRGALLVNVGRGELLDDVAVVDALRSGQLGGAALDVFPREPLTPASPYWDLPNVIVTPHVSGAMDDYWTPLVALFSDNLRRFERGEPLLNQVDQEHGY